MYRPNRIGPHPLVTLEAGVRPLTSINETPFGTTVGFQATEAVAAISRRADNIIYTAQLDVAAVSLGSVVVKIVGSQLFDTEQYLISYSGSLRGFTTDEGLMINPIIGRTSANGTATGVLQEYALLPGNAYGGNRTSGAETAGFVVSCNGSVIEGDFSDIGTFLENDIAFGFMISNGGATTAGINDLRLSLSIHRYEFDLQSFDPNR